MDDEEIVLPAGATVGIAHPLHLGTAMLSWSELFADYEIHQPFPQLGREVHRLTDAERDATSLTRFADGTVSTFSVVGLERKGWSRGAAYDNGVVQWMERIVPGNRVAVLDLDPGIPVYTLDSWPEQKLAGLRVNHGRLGDQRYAGVILFRELDPITVSEVLREVTGLFE